MRKIYIKTLVLSLSIFIFAGAFAQENVIKTSISGFALGDFSLSYERETFNNQSLQFRLGYFQPTLSPFIGEKTITPKEYSLLESRGTIQTSAEYRWYTRKDGLHGFYFGPYLRYYGFQASYSDFIRSDLFEVSGTFNSLGAGIQLGYQFLINQIFSVDLSFFGAGIDRNLIKLVYRTTQPGFDYNTIFSDVSESFDDIPYLEKRQKNKVNNDNLTSRVPFLFPGLKAGITVGIAF